MIIKLFFELDCLFFSTTFQRSLCYFLEYFLEIISIKLRNLKKLKNVVILGPLLSLGSCFLTNFGIINFFAQKNKRKRTEIIRLCIF